MSPVIVRRAAALGLVLALVVTGVAVADTVTADGDAITAGNQTSVSLGEVAPGATRSVDVDFVLACKGSSHVDARSTIAVVLASQSVPGDGSTTVTPGRIEVPANWPAPGEACGGEGPVTSTTPAHVVITAPTTVGTGQSFDFLFGFDPDTAGVTNTTALTVLLDVVEPAPTPPPTEPPTPSPSPTESPSAPPTTPPSEPPSTPPSEPPSAPPTEPPSTPPTEPPTSPPSEPPASTPPAEPTPGPAVSAWWGPPLDTAAMPALVGKAGRTIPLKLRLVSGNRLMGPTAMAAPRLALERLGACASTAVPVERRAGGSFRWEAAAWHRNLDTKGLAPGCWRLVATVDGVPVAEAVVRLTGAAPAVIHLDRNNHRSR